VGGGRSIHCAAVLSLHESLHVPARAAAAASAVSPARAPACTQLRLRVGLGAAREPAQCGLYYQASDLHET
jgi:hypothetical protein